MRRDVIEPIVGALVLLVAGAFAWYAYTSTGAGLGRTGYEVIAQFDRVGSLTSGSDVRISGIKVGTITGLALDPKTYVAEVRIGLASSVQLPEDSVAQITSDGLLGGQYLSIAPGNADRALKAGERLRYTQAPVDLMQLLGKFMFSLGDQPAGDKPKQ